MKALRGPLATLAALLALSFALPTSLPARAQDHPPAPSADQKDADKGKEAETPIPPEKSSVTHHEFTAGGKSLKYTATAGTLLIRNEDDKPYGSIFYVAYTLDGADPASRPVSFLYNGGPGSASLWLHMGSFGPVRIQTASPDATPGASLQAGPQRCLPARQIGPRLHRRAAHRLLPRRRQGYAQGLHRRRPGHLRAFNLFIQRYLSVNQRWNSPKFLIGESYGTTRSAALADMLGNSGVQLNGVVLISSILNYNIRAGGYDSIYVFNLPSYAAAAWYFNKIPNKPADVSTWVQQAREFAAGPYAAALFEGDRLPAAELDDIAKQVAHFTGLSVDYIKEANLRISPTRFRKEVLRDDRKTLGRYDMRFEGVDADAAGENPAYDASDTGITGAFVASLHDYLERELKYESTDAYRPSADSIGQWDWKHHPTSGSRGPGMEQSQPYVAADLASAIRKNPHLKVFSANGYFDLATPFFATEYDLDHMNLDPALRGNVHFGYYPSGHMIYLNVDALHKLSAELGSFITSASK